MSHTRHEIHASAVTSDRRRRRADECRARPPPGRSQDANPVVPGWSRYGMRVRVSRRWGGD